jgi:penicillin-insensitive murein DD-endopeptidase
MKARLALCFVAFAAAAAPDSDAKSPFGKVNVGTESTAATRLTARSVGSPTAGRLEGGVELKPGSALRLRRPEGARWGLPQLVRLIERGSRRVARRYPGSVLLVGDLSGEKGGKLAAHRSHESGRDADVGFYFVRADGEPVALPSFHRVGWNGHAVDAPAYHFDDARNWALIQALVTDSRVRVQHIFVAAPLRQRLLNHARRAGVYLPVLHRAAIAMKQPSRGLPHDDHFHIRIHCPPRMGDVCVPEAAEDERTASR